MRGYQYIPQEVKEFIAIPSKTGTKSHSKQTTENDEKSNGDEASTSNYLSLPSFFSSSETKTESSIDPAKVDEHDGVIYNPPPRL